MWVMWYYNTCMMVLTNTIAKNSAMVTTVLTIISWIGCMARTSSVPPWSIPWSVARSPVCADWDCSSWSSSLGLTWLCSTIRFLCLCMETYSLLYMHSPAKCKCMWHMTVMLHGVGWSPLSLWITHTHHVSITCVIIWYPEVFVLPIFSAVQIFSKWGTVPCEVFGPPCNLIWDLLRCQALQIYKWLWGQFSPYECSIQLAQYQRHCYRCDEHACEYVYQVHIKYIC